jgi:hypothetical protein
MKIIFKKQLQVSAFLAGNHQTVKECQKRRVQQAYFINKG